MDKTTLKRCGRCCDFMTPFPGSEAAGGPRVCHVQKCAAVLLTAAATQNTGDNPRVCRQGNEQIIHGVVLPQNATQL